MAKCFIDSVTIALLYVLSEFIVVHNVKDEVQFYLKLSDQIPIATESNELKMCIKRSKSSSYFELTDIQIILKDTSKCQFIMNFLHNFTFEQHGATKVAAIDELTRLVNWQLDMPVSSLFCVGVKLWIKLMLYYAATFDLEFG
ncbi:hypothetical protein QTP88_008036 [Uroleucon formosanum]